MKRWLNHLRMIPPATEALFWLIVAWLTLDVLPGKLYRRLLPPLNPPSSSKEWDRAPAATEIHRIVHAVRWISSRMPVRSMCFHQGIAADRMLRRRDLPSEMHYGIQRLAEQTKAHVWVTSAGRPIVGTENSRQFTEIAQFTDHVRP